MSSPQRHRSFDLSRSETREQRELDREIHELMTQTRLLYRTTHLAVATPSATEYEVDAFSDTIEELERARQRAGLRTVVARTRMLEVRVDEEFDDAGEVKHQEHKERQGQGERSRVR